MELEEAKNEVLRKIGRNVLLFQQVELLLKFLISRGKHTVLVSELGMQRAQPDETAKKQTLGQLVALYLQKYYRVVKRAQMGLQFCRKDACPFLLA